MARVTIIMRTKNSDWVVEEALKGLSIQDYDDYELLVVDSGSQDRTLEILKEYPHRLIEIEAKSYYPGNVLNMAIENSASEIIVFQNSDTIPQHPEALRNLVAAFDDEDVAAAFARQIPRPEAHSWVKKDYGSSFPNKPETPDWITYSLPFAAMRRSMWKKHPFYNAAWASEDTEWGHWATTHGYKIKYVPEAIVMHSHNYTLKQLYGRRFVEGEADAFIYALQNTPKLKGFLQLLRTTIADLFFHVFRLDFLGMLMVFPRRFVFYWAHSQGHKLGLRRKLEGNQDSSVGQKVIMDRHDSNDNLKKSQKKKKKAAS